MTKTGKSQKTAVAIGSGITLEVRYKGFFYVKWYLNGKEILKGSKPKYFEFISNGTANGTTNGLKALKIKNFNKEIAGEYKVTLNNAGCFYTKSLKVEVAGKSLLEFEGRYYVNQLFEIVPFLSTRTGFLLLLGLIALIFLIIPLMTCFGLCRKLKKLKGRRPTQILFYEEQPLLHKKSLNIQGRMPEIHGKQPEIYEKQPEIHHKLPEIHQKQPEMQRKELEVPGKKPQMHWALPEMHGKQSMHGKKALSHGKPQQPPQDLWNLGGWDDYTPPTDCRKVVAFGRTTPKPDDETNGSSTKK